MNTFDLRKLVLILALLAFGFGSLFAQISQAVESDEQQLSMLGLSASSTSDEWIAVYFEQEAKYLDLNIREVNQAGADILDFIASKVQELAPETFASYYIPYHEVVPSSTTRTLLDQATAVEPNNSLAFDDYVAQGEVNRDSGMKKKYAQKLEAASVYSLPTMEYNFNVLNSLPSNAFLITYGHDDTYPLWIWQEMFGTAPNVQVINIDLLSNAQYCIDICQRLNIPNIDAGSLNAQERIKYLLSGQNTNIYLALTISPSILKKHSKNLYLTGLALHYAKVNEYNLAQLSGNWENRFARTYIDVDEPINQNYKLMFTVLADYYAESNNPEMLNSVEIHLDKKKSKVSKSTSKKRPAAY
jgi:hypothetical protein